MTTRKYLVIVITLIAILMLPLTSCGKSSNTVNEQSQETIEEVENEFPGLIFIDSTSAGGGNIRTYRLYDPETLVMYAYIRQGNNAASVGGVIMLVNSDGTPRLYNIEK